MRKSYVFAGAAAAIVGLLLLCVPHEIVRAAIIGLGAEAVINGVFSLLTMRSLSADTAFRRSVHILGATSIAVGAAAIMLPLVVAGTMWTIMLYVLACYLVAAAALKLYAAAKLRGTGAARKQYVPEAVLSVAVAALLFVIPRQIGTAVLRIIGGVSLAVGIGFLVTVFRAYKRDTETSASAAADDTDA